MRGRGGERGKGGRRGRRMGGEMRGFRGGERLIVLGGDGVHGVSWRFMAFHGLDGLRDELDD